MKKVNQIIQMTAEDYEEFILTSWMRWCESVTIDHREFLRVFSNSTVNRWFISEMKRLEEEFRFLVSRYDVDDPRNLLAIKHLFSDTTVQIFSIFPKGLLAEAKKVTDKKVDGIPINKLTITQN